MPQRRFYAIRPPGARPRRMGSSQLGASQHGTHGPAARWVVRRPHLVRTWSFVKIAGPAIASASALIISMLTYIDQHRANEVLANENQQQAIEDQEQYARLVSAWFTSDNIQTGRLVVQNLSTGLVSDVVVDGWTVPAYFGNGPKPVPVDLNIGAIPPCETATGTLKTLLAASGQSAEALAFGLLTFDDANGIS